MLKATRHRGADPEDARSFGAGRHPALYQATSDLCWLLDHSYGITAAAEAMRRILVERARRRTVLKRRGGAGPATLDEIEIPIAVADESWKSPVRKPEIL